MILYLDNLIFYLGCIIPHLKCFVNTFSELSLKNNILHSEECGIPGLVGEVGLDKSLQAL